MQLAQDYSQDFEPRFRFSFTLILAMLALISLRLYYLQVVRGNYYRLFSEENSIRPHPISAIRGDIVDRHGEVLVTTRPSFDLILTPQYVADPPAALAILEELLGMPREQLEKIWAKRKEAPAYQPLVIASDVSSDIVSWVRSRKVPWSGEGENTVDLRGVDIALHYEREYPDGDAATHLLGFVNEIDAPTLKKFQTKFPGRYHRGDPIGTHGIEAVWDLDLKGWDGYEEKVVNAAGREVDPGDFGRELVRKESVNGGHLKLTVDARLQRVARDALRGKSGAVVAMDPMTGEVLLLYSAPSFDLNRLAGRERQELWRSIATSPKNFLLNRVLQGAYPPGSTYKIVTGTAALQEKKVREETAFFCPGYLPFGSRLFHCWKDTGHGTISFHKALVESCDVYFYQAGLKVGVDTLSEYAHAFGLGELTGLELAEERSGFIPTSQWKLERRKEPWQEGETLSIAIGQGYNTVTPIQAMVMVAEVASLGKKVQPHLALSLIDSSTGEEVPADVSVPKERKSSVMLDPTILKRVREALVGVVAEPGGTAHRLSELKIPMGGKTGTAQVVSLGKDCRGSLCEDHAWFVAFAPVEEPKIAVAVLVEHGGHGSSAAAPIAGEIIKTYLTNEEKTVR